MLQLLEAKEVFSAVAIVLTFIAFGPYILSIWRGKARPHAFSWVIWGAGTIVVAIAQLSDMAGAGAWPIALSGVITIGVAALAFLKAGDTRFLRVDWVFLLLAASALPLWYATSEALSAVVILTFVDLLGFGPSVRKVIQLPHEENATFFGLGALRNGFVLLALEHYSWTTALFPAAVGGACIAFAALILIRRRAVGSPLAS
ncbi:MAG: hypothetical protein KDA53_07395 [Hyphomonas sp.]|nr:hypothetical protein [Hyphomonas sp.]